jgi:hypothetical protein
MADPNCTVLKNLIWPRAILIGAILLFAAAVPDSPHREAANKTTPAETDLPIE